MTERFKGKVVLISGAGQGIGLATAKRMSSEGAIIIAGILDDSQAEAVKDDDSVRLNVRHEESWDATMDSLKKSHGGLDVLINDAGISPQATAEETTREFWDEVMEINLRGSFLGCQKAIPIMRNRGGGAIVMGLRLEWGGGLTNGGAVNIANVSLALVHPEVDHHDTLRVPVWVVVDWDRDLEAHFTWFHIHHFLEL